MIDLLLVGGGLANTLIALRLAQLRPEIRTLIVERESSLGGNHTWSFHQTDLTESQHAWIAPLVAHRWPAHEVHFPEFQRTLESAYASISSAQFAAHATQVLAGRLRLDCDVREVAPNHITLTSGEQIAATAVIDARGDPSGLGLTLGYQKFVGIEVRTRAPHGVRIPILMDATIPQHDGFRFMYTLPLGSDRLLLEETHYSDGPSVDAAIYQREILAYAQAKGWKIESIEREERGVLPVALGGNPLAGWPDEPSGVGRAGLAAALFHPTTGYSLGEAIRLADAIAALSTINATSIYSLTRATSARRWQQNSFYRLVNRMLFGAAQPSQRYKVLQRFYRLDLGLIQRFYAGSPRLRDKARVLIGRPPVPFFAAVACLPESSMLGTRGGTPRETSP